MAYMPARINTTFVMRICSSKAAVNFAVVMGVGMGSVRGTEELRNRNFGAAASICVSRS
uniref:Uncharacterized protein n=1 Tax=Ralstonia solanacearum TaxID=305 RepID=A0A0S4W2Y9_RALSL|nr:protein of unknown function [Ralstonia solanacearum]CUV31779.1 protein of unknown function [Ralstonia solanacearum]CUV36381.1 protein of unknown function [Ralstonia solanacearum]CUV41208.1 protein of unknown function [Ralstonia solanacearum]CUV61123.1 protein of unknown function [Ralstonia solanacearum]